MMYEVYLDGKLLYYPNDETFEILNAKLELALNEAGSFEFDIPSSNLRYDEFNLRQSMIQVKQNDVEIFYGEVREVTQNFDFTKHVYAVGELAFLFDSIQPQAKYQTTPAKMFESLLNQHNSQVESRKQFKYGIVSVTDSNNYIYRYTNREDTLTAMRDKLCDSLDGYLRIRKDSTTGTRYLDLVPLANYGSYCNQEIEFGENLLDYSCNMTSADIATCVIPLGARLDEEARTSAAIENLDEYLTIVGQPVTDYHKKKTDDFLLLDSAIKSYGYVRVVKQWDDITTASELVTKAVKWLKSAQYETMTLELSALDLSLLDANIDTFDVGDTIHAWAEPFDMDTTFPVQKKTIYLNDLSKNSVVLGSSLQKSYTTQASNAVNDLADTIPAVSPILENAKNNALKLLNGSVGGHVIMQFDKTNSYVEQMLICNASTEAASTQKWVWNLSGLGYMYRKNINSSWTDLNVAITMDGHIIANFITSGLLRLTGANSGTSSTSGAHLQVYDGSTLIGSWGSDGISITKGSINLGNNFTVDTNGKAVIKSGSINLGNNFIADTSGKVTIKSGSINLDDNFIVNTSGKATIKSGSINLNDNFIADTSGKVTIKSGSINLNDNFTVDTNGKTAIKSGSISLGLNKDKTYNFTVDNNGKVAIKSGSINLDDNFVADTSGKVTIKSGSINLNDKFVVDTKGNLTATNASITGKIAATSGTIGSNSVLGSRWQIGDKALYNGITKVTTNKAGTYVGVDGMRFQNTKGEYVQIYNGNLGSNAAINTTGNLGGKNISATGNISAGGNVTSSGNVTAGGAIQANKFQINSENVGYTGAFSVMVGTNKYKVVTVIGGIITKVADVN